MVIPLMKQAADEQGKRDHGTLRYGAAWAAGAASAVDARRALRALLAHVPHRGRAPVPKSLAVDAELVVSELVTNALRHAPGIGGLTLRLSDRELAITVWDGSPDAPLLRKPDRHRVGGHGLHLVHSVCDRVVVASRGRGKEVTACLRLPLPTTSALMVRRPGRSDQEGRPQGAAEGQRLDSPRPGSSLAAASE
ncbi:ATP-binding protein [Streptomyces olindensis]|uniref:ATP-binding protein n=1 Tax=Streptomyces olindensis TaxID=358823 RepID=UPI00368FE8B0